MHNSKNNSTTKPTFFVYPKRKSSATNDAVIYMRISFQFVNIEKSLGIKIPFDHWDAETRKISKLSIHQKKFELAYDECKEKIMGAFYLLSKNTTEPTLREIVDLAYAEEEKKGYSLFSVFTDFLLKMEKTTTLKRQIPNLNKHKTCMRHLKAFVKHKYKVNDISFNRINRNFIDDFELFLKSDCNNAHNSCMKMLRIFRRIYMIAVNHRWTSHNAFIGKKMTYVDVDIEVLTDEELQELKQFVFVKPHHKRTKEMFLFCVYTGLAYVYLSTLTRKHIEHNKQSGQYMLRKRREKTGVEALLPLFEPAKLILETWIPDWEKQSPDTLLAPKISNQKFNNYLGEIISLLGIQKKISTHCGRHTFATTVALENGVGIETVSKMLGHSKIAQTQKYAKVTALKIERETKDLSLKLKI